INPIDRTEKVSIEDADGRVIAKGVESSMDVPHYDRAAMDGWAVRAEDTYGATRGSPRVLEVSEGEGGKKKAV
ncbi:MAG: molybdopterin molybdenumtransferase MoeA, partial [Halobacteria archaeon]|nr:molybdopterin molybdenumtransferase MoeA [Halobacteria archaeon]